MATKALEVAEAELRQAQRQAVFDNKAKVQLSVLQGKRDRLRLNRHAAVTLALTVALVALALVPWRATVTAGALLRAERETGLFVARPGQLAMLAPAGSPVTAGNVALRLTSPDVAYDLERTARAVTMLRGQAVLMAGDRELLERQSIAWQELVAAVAEHQGHVREQARLEVPAAFVGTVVEVAEGLTPGDWLAAGEEVGRLVDLRQPVIEAYVAEADLGRIAAGTRAWFYPKALERPTVEAVVVTIDAASTRRLPAPELASLYGGTVAVREDSLQPDGSRELVPETPVYRVRLAPVGEQSAPTQVVRGQVVLEGERVGLAAQLWRRTLGLAIRESGF